MKKRTMILVSTILMMSIILACGFSFGDTGLSDTEKLQTAVAATIAANQPSQVVPTIAAQPTLQPTIAPAKTAVVPPTAIPLPCNQAFFISETIPDGTEFNSGQDFDKSWRLKNTGTCTWNTNYKILFADGDKMGGPSSKNLTISVAPGEQYDFLIDLTAPNTADTYKGFWKIADDQGKFFVHNLWVEIKVKAPAAAVTKTITLNPVTAESGSVRSGGTLHSGLLNVGDTETNLGSQVFLSFDISGIPDGATINEVKLKFNDNDTLGDPFASLGYLRMYEQDYGTLDAGDYFVGAALGALVRWGNMAEVNAIIADAEVKSSLQDKVGSNRYKIRLQFNDTTTDGANDGDMVRFGTPQLVIKYTE